MPVFRAPSTRATTPPISTASPRWPASNWVCASRSIPRRRRRRCLLPPTSSSTGRRRCSSCCGASEHRGGHGANGRVPVPGTDACLERSWLDELEHLAQIADRRLPPARLGPQGLVGAGTQDADGTHPDALGARELVVRAVADEQALARLD